MTIGAISGNPLLWLSQSTNSRTNAAQSFAPNVNGSANSAAPQTILPPSSAAPISFENVIALQRLDEPELEIAAPTATQLFLEEARKSPMERMREQILEALGLTEADLAEMTPEERAATEEKISQMLQEKMRLAMGADQDAPASNAQMLSDLM